MTKFYVQTVFLALLLVAVLFAKHYVSRLAAAGAPVDTNAAADAVYQDPSVVTVGETADSAPAPTAEEGHAPAPVAVKP